MGTQTCAADGMSWSSCSGGQGPVGEKCDRLDHDCDGESVCMEVDNYNRAG